MSGFQPADHSSYAASVPLRHTGRCKNQERNTMGKVFKFDNDVDTDQIIASQYLLFPSVEEMAPHTFESLDADFAASVKPGDFVVAADNFGCGSSREQAPSVLKALGVKAVLAKSFCAYFLPQLHQYRTSRHRVPRPL